eukprot:scaffold20912_cov126-Isochrysis_galbana.AAC.2
MTRPTEAQRAACCLKNTRSPPFSTPVPGLISAQRVAAHIRLRTPNVCRHWRAVRAVAGLNVRQDSQPAVLTSTVAREVC